MLKRTVKQLIQRSGACLVSTSHLGIEVELDLARICANPQLKTVFDVGANVGQTACTFARAFPSATIYSFEPVPASFSRLQDMTKKLNQVKAFNIALGETAGSARINITSSSEFNSLKEIKDSTGTVEVSVDTVDHFCDANQIDFVDLLKIDVEGFELPVLRGAIGRLSAGKVRFIYAECTFSANDEMPHTSFFDLHEFLTGKGFCFVCYYPLIFNLRLGCSMGNVLYALKDLLPPEAPGSVRNIV